MRRWIPALAYVVAVAACSPAAEPGSARLASPPTTTAAAAGTTAVTATTRATASAVPGPTTTTPPAPTTVPAPATTAGPTGLVDVRGVEPSIVVALRYLTADNLTGAPLPGYEANRAYLQPAAADALARAQRRLAGRGLGLKVFDAYRPVRATQALVDWAVNTGQGALVGPYIGTVSYHNSGQAVDLTVVERATGRELDMGTPFDSLSPAANTANATGTAAANRALLVEAMESEGFENYAGEWWHFNFFVPGASRLDDPVR